MGNQAARGNPHPGVQRAAQSRTHRTAQVGSHNLGSPHRDVVRAPPAVRRDFPTDFPDLASSLGTPRHGPTLAAGIKRAAATLVSVDLSGGVYKTMQHKPLPWREVALIVVFTRFSQTQSWAQFVVCEGVSQQGVCLGRTFHWPTFSSWLQPLETVRSSRNSHGVVRRAPTCGWRGHCAHGRYHVHLLSRACRQQV